MSKLNFVLEMSKTLGNICIDLYLYCSVLLVAFVKHISSRYFLTLFADCQNLCFLMLNFLKCTFIYVFYSNNSGTSFRKTSITRECLVAESCPTPC